MDTSIGSCNQKVQTSIIGEYTLAELPCSDFLLFLNSISSMKLLNVNKNDIEREYSQDFNYAN